MVFSYSTFDWFNRLIIPILTASVSIFLYRFIVSGKSPKWLGWVFEQLKKILWPLILGWSQFLPLVKAIRLQYDSREKCIIVPVFIAIFLFVLFNAASFYFTHKQIASYGEPLWLALLSSVVIGPISEEILVRGILFGIVIVAAINLLVFSWSLMCLAISGKNKKVPLIRSDLPFGLIVVGLLIQGAYFGAAHDNDNILSLMTRAISGVAYGALFYFNKKNLMPATVCHATYNLLIILSTPVSIF